MAFGANFWCQFFALMWVCVSNKKPNSAENCGSIFLTAAPLKMGRTVTD
jgi:hypothetical protein